MSKILPILIQRLTKDYHVLRDIYILMEAEAWLTNVALENDDQDQVEQLSFKRQQYNEFVKAREVELHATEQMLCSLLGWQEFSMHRLLNELESPNLEELSKVTTEIQTIIRSMARIDMNNYHLQQHKADAGKEQDKLTMLQKKASKAYLDNSFVSG